MSIIQDALRRREQEGGEGGRPEINRSPAAPPPPVPPFTPPIFPTPPVPMAGPPPITTTEPGTGRRKTGGLVAVLVILLVAVGAGFWGYREGWFAKQPAAPQPPVASAKPSPTPAQSSVGQLVENVREVVRDAKLAAAPAPESKTPATPEAAPAQPAAALEPVPAAPAPRPSPSVLDRLRGAKEGAWPKFNVRGVVSPASGRRGMVILDQEMLEEGRVSKQGLRVAEIKGQTAVLEHQGERRSYLTGEGEP